MGDQRTEPWAAAPAFAAEIGQPADAAQPAPEQPSSSQDDRQDGTDIVVTARRTEERLQDVPVSIVAFTQETLTERNINAGRDLATYTPSLSATARNGSDFASFSIRGFAQADRTTASVGVYFADAVVPRNSPVSAAGDGAGPGNFFDLQNVQVLRGPQGTLFGRNTTGGAILLVPQRPTDRFEGYVEGSYGNYDMQRVQAVVNIPVSDSFRIRAGIDRQQRDGYLQNITGIGPDNFADIDYVAARFSAVVTLSPDIENYTVISYQNSATHGAASRITDCYAGSAAAVTTNGPFTFGCQQINRERAANLPDLYVTNWLPFAYQEVESWQIVNTFRWNINDHLTIKNINSFGEVRQDQAVDLFGLFIPVGSTLTVPTTTAPFFSVRNVPTQFQGNAFGIDTSISPPNLHAGHQANFTQELQVQGDFMANRLRYQAGLYYEHSTPMGFSGTQSMAGVLCGVSQPAIVEWQNFTCTDQAAVTGNATTQGNRNRQVAMLEFTTKAVYAQASFDILPNLTVDAGIRYTWDDTQAQRQLVIASYTAATGFNTPRFSCTNPFLTYVNSPADCTENLSQSSEAPTWILGLNWRPIQDVLLYLKYSRGYRQGSISAFAAQGFERYEPEQVDVYEAGVRASWRGAIPGSINLTGFYNDFTNMQLQVSFVDTNGIAPNLASAPAIVNAGAARIYGLEAEGQLRPFRGFSIGASYSYLNTELIRFTPPDLSTQPPGYYNLVASTPVQGDRLNFVPEHKVTVTANYTLPLPESVGRISFGGTWVYTGDIFFGRDASINNRVLSVFAPTDPNYSTSLGPSYQLVTLHADWENIAGTSISAQFFMTNAFDERYYESRSLSGSRGFTNRYYAEPQMYGVRLRYNFGGS